MLGFKVERLKEKKNTQRGNVVVCRLGFFKTPKHNFRINRIKEIVLLKLPEVF